MGARAALTDFGAVPNPVGGGYLDITDHTLFTEAVWTAGTGTKQNDTGVTFNGVSSVRLDIPAGTTRIDLGTSGATMALRPEAVLDSCWVIKMDANIAARATDFSPYVGDATYANFYQKAWGWGNTAGIGLVDKTAWHAVLALDSDYIKSGSLTPATARRGKFRFNLAAGSAGSLWIGYWGPIPKPRTSRLAIVMDQTYSSISALAYAEFVARRIPMSFSVIGSKVGTSGFMTEAQIRALLDATDIDVVAFNTGWANLTYGSLGTTAAQLADIIRCRSYLIDTFGPAAAPGADILMHPMANAPDQAIVDALATNGFQFGFSGYSQNMCPVLQSTNVRRRLSAGRIGNMYATGDSLATAKSRIDTLIGLRANGILEVGNVVASGATGSQANLADLRALLNYAAEKVMLGQLTVVPITEFVYGADPNYYRTDLTRLHAKVA